MAAKDLHKHLLGGSNDASEYFEPITPSDTEELAYITRQIRANTGGIIVCERKDGVVVPMFFAAGESRALRVKKIWGTHPTVGATTCTGIEVLC